VARQFVLASATICRRTNWRGSDPPDETTITLWAFARRDGRVGLEEAEGVEKLVRIYALVGAALRRLRRETVFPAQ